MGNMGRINNNGITGMGDYGNAGGNMSNPGPSYGGGGFGPGTTGGNMYQDPGMTVPSNNVGYGKKKKFQGGPVNTDPVLPVVPPLGSINPSAPPLLPPGSFNGDRPFVPGNMRFNGGAGDSYLGGSQGFNERSVGPGLTGSVDMNAGQGVNPNAGMNMNNMNKPNKNGWGGTTFIRPLANLMRGRR